MKGDRVVFILEEVFVVDEEYFFYFDEVRI